MKHLESFAQRLRAARRTALERAGLDLSQAQPGERLGVTGQTVSLWETGVVVPSVEVMEAIAKELGVTPGWLAFAQEPRYPEPARRSRANNPG